MFNVLRQSTNHILPSHPYQNHHLPNKHRNTLDRRNFRSLGFLSNGMDLDFAHTFHAIKVFAAFLLCILNCFESQVLD